MLIGSGKKRDASCRVVSLTSSLCVMFLWAFIIRIRQAFKNASRQHPKWKEIKLRAYTHIGLIPTLLLNSVLRFLALLAALDARRDSTNFDFL
jgi:L-asparagine transporter-like permease